MSRFSVSLQVVPRFALPLCFLPHRHRDKESELKESGRESGNEECLWLSASAQADATQAAVCILPLLKRSCCFLWFSNDHKQHSRAGGGAPYTWGRRQDVNPGLAKKDPNAPQDRSKIFLGDASQKMQAWH